MIVEKSRYAAVSVRMYVIELEEFSLIYKISWL